MRFGKPLRISLRRVGVSTLISFLFVAAQAQPAFVRKDFPVPGSFLESGAVAVGDFNGDGKPDVAAASTAGISILLNQGGAGGFRFGNPVVTAISQDAAGLCGPAVPGRAAKGARLSRPGRDRLQGQRPAPGRPGHRDRRAAPGWPGSRGRRAARG